MLTNLFDTSRASDRSPYSIQEKGRIWGRLISCIFLVELGALSQRRIEIVLCFGCRYALFYAGRRSWGWSNFGILDRASNRVNMWAKERRIVYFIRGALMLSLSSFIVSLWVQEDAENEIR